MVASIGWVGLQHILSDGGAGYFPLRLLQDLIDTGRVTLVPDAPRFTQPAYVVYPTEADPAVFNLALDGLRQIAAGV